MCPVRRPDREAKFRWTRRRNAHLLCVPALTPITSCYNPLLAATICEYLPEPATIGCQPRLAATFGACRPGLGAALSPVRRRDYNPSPEGNLVYG